MGQLGPYGPTLCVSQGETPSLPNVFGAFAQYEASQLVEASHYRNVSEERACLQISLSPTLQS